MQLKSRTQLAPDRWFFLMMGSLPKCYSKANLSIRELKRPQPKIRTWRVFSQRPLVMPELNHWDMISVTLTFQVVAYLCLILWLGLRSKHRIPYWTVLTHIMLRLTPPTATVKLCRSSQFHIREASVMEIQYSRVWWATGHSSRLSFLFLKTTRVQHLDRYTNPTMEARRRLSQRWTLEVYKLPTEGNHNHKPGLYTQLVW